MLSDKLRRSQDSLVVPPPAYQQIASYSLPGYPYSASFAPDDICSVGHGWAPHHTIIEPPDASSVPIPTPSLGNSAFDTMLSFDGEYVAVAMRNFTPYLRVWRRTNTRPSEPNWSEVTVPSIPKHSTASHESGTSAVWSPSGRYLIFNMATKTYILDKEDNWNIKYSAWVGTNSDSAVLMGALWAEDESWVITAGLANNFHVVDTSNWTEVSTNVGSQLSSRFINGYHRSDGTVLFITHSSGNSPYTHILDPNNWSLESGAIPEVDNSVDADDLNFFARHRYFETSSDPLNRYVVLGGKFYVDIEDLTVLSDDLFYPALSSFGSVYGSAFSAHDRQYFVMGASDEIFLFERVD